MNALGHELNSLAAGWVLVLAALVLNAIGWANGGVASAAFPLGVVLAAASIFVAHMTSGLIAQGTGELAYPWYVSAAFALGAWAVFVGAALYQEF